MIKSMKLIPLAAAVLATAATNAQQLALEEVIVTAQKRSESLMDVPIAISVFNGQMVEDLSARNLTDLGRFTAGVEMNNHKSLQPTYTIRGVETNDWTVGSDPAVAVYVDGVYAARGGGAEAALADLERIEVLKGPQGTLFGRNATGGAIHLISRRPSQEQEGRIKLTAGNYNRLDGEVMFNQPLTDDLAMRFVGITRTHDGWIDNRNGKDLNDADQQAFRLGFLWDATPNTEVFWLLDYSELDQNSAAQHTLINAVWEGTNPGKLDDFGDVSFDLINEEKREMFATSLEINHDIGDMTFTSITGWREFDTEFNEDLDGSNNPDYTFNSSNPDENDYFSQEFRLTGASDTLKWTVGGGYSKEHVKRTTTATFNVSSLETFAWAEILRGVGGDTSNSFLSVIVGLSPEEIASLEGLTNTEVGEILPSYRQQMKDSGLDGIAASAFIWSFLDGEGRLDDFGLSDNVFLGIPQILADLQPRIAAFDPWEEFFSSKGTYESWAIYGDATWSITDRMNLTGGIRYTYDDKEFDLYTEYQNQIVGADFGLAFYNNGQPVIDATQNDDWDNISGRIVLDYALGEDSMIYGSIATGFKSGGFNSLNFGPEVETSYDEEEVINYEVGLMGRYLENTLSLSVSAFFYEYDNLQELKLLGSPLPSYNLRNSDAEGYGMEIETTWLATENLTLAGNYSWLETEYTDFNVNYAAGETDEDDLTGDPRAGTPEHKVNLSIVYIFDIGEFGQLIPRVDYSWNDERVESITDPTRTVDSFSVTNARVTWLGSSGRWEAALWATNLFDEEVHTEYGDNGDTLGTLTGSRIPPRMYGADIVFNF
jgi:iron complex outermembrane receptor protein